MNNNKSGGMFRALLAAAFMIGTAVYIFAAAYTDGVISKVGFGMLAFFSLMSGAGISMTDMQDTVGFRFSTKLTAVMFPLSINLGALATEIFLIKHHDTAALAAAAAGALAAVICSAVLVRRYREDDF